MSKFKPGDIVIHNGSYNRVWTGAKIEFIRYDMYDRVVGYLLQDTDGFSKGCEVILSQTTLSLMITKKEHLPEWF